jgi:hypothetical protein
MVWKTIFDDGESLKEVHENGSILRHGSAEHTHHEFYKNYNPQAVTSWYRGSPAELIETVRKCRREEE